MTPAHVLARLQPVPPWPVFAVGVKENGVTLASQQRRAIHLIDALVGTGTLAAGSPLAIVGAGAAGLTAAVRAAAAGCDVVILEKDAEVLATFRGSRSRLLHPNLYAWPLPHWHRARADVPILGWSADTAGAVASVIEAQFRSEARRTGLIDLQNGVEVHWQWPPAKRGELLELTWTQGGVTRTRAFAAIVLAVGFGKERRTGGAFPGYWENDRTEQAAGARRLAYLVQGAGDGGLTDLLRIRLERFDQADLVQMLMRDGGSARADALAQAVDHIERAGLEDAEMDRAYRELQVAWLETALERSGFRPHTVVLNDRYPALGHRRFPLNKLLASRFLRRGEAWGVRWVQGDLIVNDPGPDGRIEVDLGAEAGGRQAFDRVLIRRGAEAAIDAFGAEVAAGCATIASGKDVLSHAACPLTPPAATDAASLAALAVALGPHERVIDVVRNLLVFLRQGVRAADDVVEDADFVHLRDEALALLERAVGRHALLVGAPTVAATAARFVAGRIDRRADVVARALVEAIDHLWGRRLHASLRGAAGAAVTRRFLPNQLYPRHASVDDRPGRRDGGLEQLALAPIGQVHLLVEWTLTAWRTPLRVAPLAVFRSLDELRFAELPAGGFFGAVAADPVAHAAALERALAALPPGRVDFVVLPEFALHADRAWAERARARAGCLVFAGVGHALDGVRSVHHRLIALDRAAPVLAEKAAASTYVQRGAAWLEDIHVAEHPEVRVVASADGRAVAVLAGEDCGTDEYLALVTGVRPTVVLGVAGPIGAELEALVTRLGSDGIACLIVGLEGIRSLPGGGVEITSIVE